MLHREKFHLREDLIQKVIEAFRQYGIEVLPQPTGAILIDMDDLVFYEVTMEKQEDDAYIFGWAVYPASQVLLRVCREPFPTSKIITLINPLSTYLLQFLRMFCNYLFKYFNIIKYRFYLIRIIFVSVIRISITRFDCV